MLKTTSLIPTFFVLSTLVTLSMSFSISAHGIWFAERSSLLAFIYGEGADDLNVIKRQHKIEDIQAFDQNWQPIKAQLKINGPLLTVNAQQEFNAVAAVLNNGIWSKTKNNKWVAKGRDEVPNAKLSERTYKYAVHLPKPLQKIPSLPKQILQIIPVGEVFPVKSGKTVIFKVLFKGKTIAGAKIIADFVNDPDAKPVITNNKGIATIAIRNQGLNVVAAVYDEKIDDSTVIDKIEHLATLSFVLPHEEE